MKPRINVYLDYDLHKRVEKFKAKTGLSKSGIVEIAVAQFLSPESADKREAAIAKRLNQLTRQFGRLERDLIIHSEAQALFVKYYLTITPPIPVRDQKAARATGHERFENFITHLGKRLSEGPSLIDKVVNDIKVKEQDFFSIDLDGQNLEKSND